MNHPISNEQLKSRFTFQVSLQFELFLALQAITDPHGRIHLEWRQAALQGLPAEFHERWELLGSWSPLWVMVGDLLADTGLSLSFDGLMQALRQIPAHEWQRRLFKAALHDAVAADRLVSGAMSLSAAIAELPASKREWLEFVGLYPVLPQAPGILALTTLQQSPDEFRAWVLRLVELFWQHVFEVTWATLAAEFRRSQQEKERLFQSCSLREFARLALLRIEVDEREQAIGAIRGGYRLPFAKLSRAIVFPSAFNDRRYWSAFEQADSIVAVFPYFDPSISLDATAASPAEPELDVALVFKALGDPTRFAMASLLGQQIRTPAELAQLLGVSRPTISHHLHQLREAGLIDEQPVGNSISLRLRREPVSQLSALTLRRLFPSEVL